MERDKPETLLRAYYRNRITQAASRDAPLRAECGFPPTKVRTRPSAPRGTKRREAPLASLLMTAAALAAIFFAASAAPRYPERYRDGGIVDILEWKIQRSDFDSAWEALRASFPASPRKGDSL